MAVKKEDPKRSRARLIGNILLLIGAGLLIINIFLPNVNIILFMCIQLIELMIIINVSIYFILDCKDRKKY